MTEAIYKDLFEEVSPAADEAVYFPLDHGRYEVKPGFFAFGTAMGNGEADDKIFQIDSNFGPYRRAKLRARAEDLEKYCRTCGYGPEVAAVIGRFMVHRLVREHAKFFDLIEEGEELALHCKLSGEVLHFDPNMALQEVEGTAATGSPPSTSATPTTGRRKRKSARALPQCTPP